MHRGNLERPVGQGDLDGAGAQEAGGGGSEAQPSLFIPTLTASVFGRVKLSNMSPGLPA